MRINDPEVIAQIGTVIKSNRLAYNLSQEELAEKSSVTRVFVNQIENGKRTPSVEALDRMALCFNKKARDLLEEAKRGEVDERVALALNLKKVLKTEDVDTLRKLIEYSKTLREPLKGD
jgi:transcriptional regulator with XRE-family HTH domain